MANEGNQHNLKYTLPIATKLFESALKILKEDESIITETELAFRCKYALSLPYSTYQYLRSEKFPRELGDIKKEIESVLETRVMKSKEMYPGIVAMTLKNKHKWRDQYEMKAVDFPVLGISISLVAPGSLPFLKLKKEEQQLIEIGPKKKSKKKT